MPADPHCIFCKIVAGKAEASVVFQDQLVTVFMDIHPVVQGHSLVVPNEHFSNLGSIDQIHAQRMFVIGQQIGEAIRISELRSEGINLFLADGSAAGQTVFHSHLHVIPRYVGDGFSLHFPVGYGAQPPRSELDKIATELSHRMKLEE
jgi:histidine triad (HIT) family protein